MGQAKPPLKSTTRAFHTTEGELNYAELSDLIAPHLLRLLDDIVSEKYTGRPFNEELIKEFHREIIGDVMPDIAGRWRKSRVQVGNWIPPEPYEIPVAMHEYVANLQTRLSNSDTLGLQLETLAYAEGELLHIHPFQDFNGRTTRAALLELLMRFNLPPIDTSVELGTPRFKQYQNALAEYDNGRITDLIEFWKSRLADDGGVIKVVVTVPPSHTKAVQAAVFEAGAGVIGNYSCCSIVTKCIGTFKPNDEAHPYLGQPGKFETVEEDKLEFVCDSDLLKPVLAALKSAHPYETPAIDLIPLMPIDF